MFGNLGKKTKKKHCNNLNPRCKLLGEIVDKIPFDENQTKFIVKVRKLKTLQIHVNDVLSYICFRWI